VSIWTPRFAGGAGDQNLQFLRVASRSRGKLRSYGRIGSVAVGQTRVGVSMVVGVRIVPQVELVDVQV